MSESDAGELGGVGCAWEGVRPNEVRGGRRD